MSSRREHHHSGKRRRPKSEEDEVRIREQSDSKRAHSDSFVYDHLPYDSPIEFQSSGSNQRDVPDGTIETWLIQQDHRNRHDRHDAQPSLSTLAVGGFESQAPTLASSSLTTPTSYLQTPTRGAKRERYQEEDDEDAEGEIDEEAMESYGAQDKAKERVARDIRGVGTFAPAPKPRRRRQKHTPLRGWFDKWV